MRKSFPYITKYLVAGNGGDGSLSVEIMKKLTITLYLLVVGMILTSPILQARSGRVPMKPSTEKAILKYLKSHLYLQKYDELGGDFSKFFKGVDVYALWKEDAPVDGEDGISASGIGYVIVRGEQVQVFDDDNRMLEKLVKSYSGKLEKPADIEALFRSLGTVKSVKDLGHGKYQVVTKKFFEDLSGFELTLKNDKTIADCHYVMAFKK